MAKRLGCMLRIKNIMNSLELRLLSRPKELSFQG